MAPAALVLLVAATRIVSAADYAREERWAREIVPALVVGDPVYLRTAARPKVLAILAEPAGVAKGGVIVVHGLGVHPDWGLNGGVRTGLAEAGFVTLSVQMPVLAADATRDDYRSTLPEAGERIAAAIAYLRERGIARIAIVAHSLGATMVDEYLARPGASAIDARVPVGMFGAFAAPPREPVLDVIAESEFPDVRTAAALRKGNLPRDGCSEPATIAGADHYFDNRTRELTAAIAAFLERALAGRC
jgi:hypothetical protein